jgi:hypothetical protein
MGSRSILAQAWAGYTGWFGYLVSLSLAAQLALNGLALALVLILGMPGLVCAVLVLVVGYFWVQAVLVEAIAAFHDDDPELGLGARFAAVRHRLNTVSVASLIAVFLVGGGILLFVLPGVILATFWCLLVPVIVLEEKGVFSGLARSRDLVRGHGWQTFCVLFLTAVLTGVSGKLVEKACLVLLPLSEGLASAFAQLVVAGLAAPFVALVTTLLYEQLRALKAPHPIAGWATSYASAPER